MFTGIIETTGTVTGIRKEGSNVHFTISSPISGAMKVDQSVAHDGVCLTVVALSEGAHTVTAIEETLVRSKLGQWKEGSPVNLERAMQANSRLDGHMVQGHVDATATCLSIDEREGSWYFRFRYRPTEEHLLVDKGSISVNGVSLTVVEPRDDTFSVAIIPYTWEHTNFSALKPGDAVNLEFDIIGKYIARYVKLYMEKD
ncbi:MAG: riboflavin synthase [Phaeodactylibacter sp.]|nr:riboflavin synthase [Phaeodactylibacter sp.]MCB9273258.1 riboflavin synthase [Lewinellaceae bacterium]